MHPERMPAAYEVGFAQTTKESTALQESLSLPVPKLTGTPLTVLLDRLAAVDSSPPGSACTSQTPIVFCFQVYLGAG